MLHPQVDQSSAQVSIVIVIVCCFFKNNLQSRPEFTNFTYVGEAIIDYQPVYHWIHRMYFCVAFVWMQITLFLGVGRDFFQFFDTVQGRRPARFDAERERQPALSIQVRLFLL
jgi:hypothetical protein